LVEVGLEAGFENIEGCGESSGCHASDTEERKLVFVDPEVSLSLRRL
jgi:hypothetical protein